MRKQKRSIIFVVTLLHTVLPHSWSFTVLNHRGGGGLNINISPQKQAFSSSTLGIKRRKRSRLFGLKEWRKDIVQNEERTDQQQQQQQRREESSGSSSILPLLAFRADDILFPGQQLSLVLKEGRFLDLFQDSIDEYHSMVGMAVMGDDGMLPYLPLCTVEDLEVNVGYRGKLTLEVTLRAVSRAKLQQLTQTKPVMMGSCIEIMDDETNNNNLVVCNELADQIEAIMMMSTTNVTTTTTTINRSQYRETYQYILNNTTAEQSSPSRINELNAISWSVFAALILSFKEEEKQKILIGTSLVERLSLGLKTLWNQQYNLDNDKAGSSITTSSSSTSAMDNAFQ